MTVYDLAKTRRVSVAALQAMFARAGLASMVIGPVLAVCIVAFWLDHRLESYEAKASSGGLMAVIDKCGNAYEHTVTRAGDWQPDEALYFEKLEEMVECTRGLRVPTERGGKSCWLKVWPTLAQPAYTTLMDLVGQYCKEQATCPLELAKHQVDVEILKGSTKSEDGRYRLQWREREPAAKRDEIWSGVFTLSRVVATAKQVAEGNAIGLRIESFTWQRDQVVGKK